MNTRAKQVARQLQLHPLDKILLNVQGTVHVTDLRIRESKYYISMDTLGRIWLTRSWTGELYGEITVSHAKRLIKINNNKPLNN